MDCGGLEPCVDTVLGFLDLGRGRFFVGLVRATVAITYKRDNPMGGHGVQLILYCTRLVPRRPLYMRAHGRAGAGARNVCAYGRAGAGATCACACACVCCLFNINRSKQPND